MPFNPTRAALALCALAVPACAFADDPATWAQRLYLAVKSQGAVSAETQLVNLTYVCSLLVGKSRWSVVNTVEFIPGANLPRAKNQIVLLDPALKVVKTLSYAKQEPLFCRDATLFLRAPYALNNEQPEGNALIFAPNGDVSVTNVDPNRLPVPATKMRRDFNMK